MIVIARNSINDFFRQQQKQLAPIDYPTRDYQDDDMYASLVSCIPGLINKLPPKYAQPLALYELEGVSQKELSQQFGMSHSGLKSRIQRGRKILKTLFIEQCGVEVTSTMKCDHEGKPCDCN